MAWNRVLAARSRCWGSGLVRLLVVATVALGLASCGSGGGGGEEPPPPPVTGTVAGAVTAQASGSAVAGARVQVAGLAAVTTGADGRFSVGGVTPGERIAVRVEANGFAPALQVVAVSGSATASVPVSLYAEGVTVQVNPAAAVEVSEPGSGARLAAPANAFRRVDGGAAPTGNLAVSITSVDPLLDPTRMPGDYTATDGSAVRTLESFGAVAVDVRDSAGNRYNLAPGTQATLRIPAGSRAGTLPQTVGLYSLDEATGRWVQEGTATLAGSGSQRWYEATITHLSWWNADQPTETIFVRGCVRTVEGQPAAGRTVSTTGQDYTGYSSAPTNALGDFVVAMKRGGIAAIQVTGGGTTPAAVLVGPSQVDIQLGTCLQERATAPPPSFLRQPQDTSTVAGSFAQFSVLADGAPPLSYQWQRNGVDIAGARSPVLTVYALAGDDQARYRVVLGSPQGSITSSEAVLTVLPVPVVAPVITAGPVSRTVAPGAVAVFSVTASGSAPLAYQWLRDGQAIAGATGSAYSLVAAAGDTGARFSATVSNAGGSVTSAEAMLTVQAPSADAPPAIVVGPVSASAFVGSVVTFSVQASGSPTLTYQWRRNGVDIAGETRATLNITVAQGDSGARYSVLVRNAFGSATSNEAVLTVVTQTGVSGSLTVTGNADAGVLGTFVPTAGFPANNSTITGPACTGTAPNQVCTSTLGLTAFEQTTLGVGAARSELLVVSISSSSSTPPGPQPGEDPTSIVVSYAVSESGGVALGFSSLCNAVFVNSPCSGYGISVDRAARRITFTNVRILQGGTDSTRWVELNGVLSY